MQHEEFAQQAAKHLEAMAASLKEDHPGGIGDGITSMRANELRVAAHVVRALSEVATRAEGHGGSARGPHGPLWRGAPRPSWPPHAFSKNNPIEIPGGRGGSGGSGNRAARCPGGMKG